MNDKNSKLAKKRTFNYWSQILYGTSGICIGFIVGRLSVSPKSQYANIIGNQYITEFLTLAEQLRQQNQNLVSQQQRNEFEYAFATISNYIKILESQLAANSIIEQGEQGQQIQTARNELARVMEEIENCRRQNIELTFTNELFTAYGRAANRIYNKLDSYLLATEIPQIQLRTIEIGYAVTNIFNRLFMDAQTSVNKALILQIYNKIIELPEEEFAQKILSKQTENGQSYWVVMLKQILSDRDQTDSIIDLIFNTLKTILIVQQS